jgi:hypothetical protein
MMVRSLIQRAHAATRFALTDQGRAVLAALRAKGERWRNGESAFGGKPENICSL